MPSGGSRMPGTLDINRRRFLTAAATAVAAAPLGLLGSSTRVNAMTDTPQETPRPTGTDKAAVRPFQFRFSDEDLADLRRRIRATRWPEQETVTDDTQGVQLATTFSMAFAGTSSRSGYGPQFSADSRPGTPKWPWPGC